MRIFKLVAVICYAGMNAQGSRNTGAATLRCLPLLCSFALRLTEPETDNRQSVSGSPRRVVMFPRWG